MIKNTQGFIRHPWCLLSANADSENKGQGRKKDKGYRQLRRKDRFEQALRGNESAAV